MHWTGSWVARAAMLLAACGTDGSSAGRQPADNAQVAGAARALAPDEQTPVRRDREPGPGPGRENRIQYAETIAGSDSSSELVPLCRLVRVPDWEGMGLYTVRSLTGYTEERFGRPGKRGGFTYVELSLVEPWHMAEKNPVARIPGGPGPDGGSLMWLVDLKVGEQVGLLLGDARPDNRGYYDIRELGLFSERADGGFSNGQLFTHRRVDAGELGRLVKGLVGARKDAPCPYDEQPDVNAVPPTAIDEPTDDSARPDAGR